MIPANDIPITPHKLYDLIGDFLDMQIYTYDHNDEFVILLKNIKKEMLLELSKTFNWQKKILSYDVCEHKFDRHSKYFGNICGRRIRIKSSKNNFLCGKHANKDHIPKKKTIDEKKRCLGKKKNGERCNVTQNKNGYCSYHQYQYIEKINLSRYSVYMETLYDYGDDTIYGNHLLEIDKFVYEDDIKYIKIIEKEFEKKNTNMFVCYYNDPLSFVEKEIVLSDDTNNSKNLNKNVGVINPENKDLSTLFNKGVKVYNNKEFLNDINIYDLYNGKKVNITKLIDYYKRLDKIKKYIDFNKKYIYLKNNNKQKEFYIKEKYINILLEYINIRYNDLYDSLLDYDREQWIILLREYKMDLDEIILDFHNIDENEKIYI